MTKDKAAVMAASGAARSNYFTVQHTQKKQKEQTLVSQKDTPTITILKGGQAKYSKKYLEMEASLD